MSLRRQERVTELIQQEISKQIPRLKYPGLGFITILAVRLSADFNLAKVYYSVLGMEEERRRTQEAVERAGHCGTLDPAARGLLLILVGSATRHQDSFLGLEKEYWFRSELGVKTSTGDRQGETIEARPPDHVTRETLENVLPSFVGNMEQTPPRYSALKYKGKPYYYYARKGLDVPRAPRAVSILSLSRLSFRLPF